MVPFGMTRVFIALHTAAPGAAAAWTASAETAIPAMACAARVAVCLRRRVEAWFEEAAKLSIGLSPAGVEVWHEDAGRRNCRRQAIG